MSKLAFGSLDQEHEVGFRDAVHMPCAIVICAERLLPGASIRFINEGEKEVTTSLFRNRHGLVDPFLETSVPPNTPFMMLLVPSIIGSLTHSYKLLLDQVPEEEEVPVQEMSECQVMGCD